MRVTVVLKFDGYDPYESSGLKFRREAHGWNSMEMLQSKVNDALESAEKIMQSGII